MTPFESTARRVYVQHHAPGTRAPVVREFFTGITNQGPHRHALAGMALAQIVSEVAAGVEERDTLIERYEGHICQHTASLPLSGGPGNEHQEDVEAMAREAVEVFELAVDLILALADDCSGPALPSGRRRVSPKRRPFARS